MRVLLLQGLPEELTLLRGLQHKEQAAWRTEPPPSRNPACFTWFLVSLGTRGCSGTPPASILYQKPKGIQEGVESCAFLTEIPTKYHFLRVHGNTQRKTSSTWEAAHCKRMRRGSCDHASLQTRG